MSEACFLVAWLLSGCSSEIVVFEPCDIRQSGCQSTVVQAVQGARGAAWDPWLDMPPIRVISKQRYFEELEADRQARQRESTRADYFTPAYKALHLYNPNEVESESSEFSVDNVAAYYRADTRDVTIIDREIDPERATRTLAHELVHAAQERDVSFSVINAWAQDVNSSQARGAIVEGEAVLYANLVMINAHGSNRGTPDFWTYHDGYLREVRADVAASKSPLREANLSLRYPLGSMYMTHAWLQGGSLGVRRAIAAHPTNALTFMLQGQQDLPTAATCLPVPPPNLQQVGRSVLGAWSLYAFLTRVTTEPMAWQLAQAWSNDVLVIYSDDAGRLAVVWQLHLSSLSGIAALADKLPPGVLMRQHPEGASLNLLARVGDADVGDWAWAACPSGN